jgi:hypothetical protein
MEGEGVVGAKEDDNKNIFLDGVTFLNNIIVFDWPAMFSGWRRTGENFAAQRISRRRTENGRRLDCEKIQELPLFYVVQSGHYDKKWG